MEGEREKHGKCIFNTSREEMKSQKKIFSDPHWIVKEIPTGAYTHCNCLAFLKHIIDGTVFHFSFYKFFFLGAAILKSSEN